MPRKRSKAPILLKVLAGIGILLLVMFVFAVLSYFTFGETSLNADEKLKNLSRKLYIEHQALIVYLTTSPSPDPIKVNNSITEILSTLEEMRKTIPYSSESKNTKEKLITVIDYLINYYKFAQKLHTQIKPMMLGIKEGNKTLGVREYQHVIDFLTEAKENITEMKGYLEGLEISGVKTPTIALESDLENIDISLKYLSHPKYRYGVVMTRYLNMVDPEDPTIKNTAVNIQKEYGYYLVDVVNGTYELFRNFSYINSGFNANGTADIDSPSEVFNRKAGNCLELSLAAASLFEAAGINAALCFVDTGRSSTIWEYNPEYFMPNHAVVSVLDDETGNWYIVDPTCAMNADTFDDFISCSDDITTKAMICRNVETGEYLI